MSSMEKSIKGGVLPMVVGISLVIISISASLLLAGYYSKLQNIGIENKLKIQRNLVSGINLFIGLKEEINYQEEISIDLFARQTDSIKLIKRAWGCFDVGIITSYSDISSDSMAIMVGVKNEGVNKSTLYLVDNRRPLSLAGETVIKGDVYLPSTGVKAAYINRAGYKGKHLVQGNIFKSETKMPSLKFETVRRLYKLFENPFSPDRIEISELPDSLFRSFLADHTLVIYCDDSLVIEESVKGNVIIKSDKVIYLKKNAIIQDVLVMAPVIIIEEGFIGSGQFICNEYITIGKNSILEYPSCIVVLDNNIPAVIEIGKSVFVDGFLFMLGNDRNSENKKLHLKDSSIFTGIAHINGFVDLKGMINGHLSCQKFLISTESGMYENHLYNVTMKNKLNDMFISPVLFEAKNSAIIKYLK